MDNQQKEGRCLICGDAMDVSDQRFAVPFLKHAIETHCLKNRCWCGADLFAMPGPSATKSLSEHLEANGGLEAHYMDHLMGVSKENQ